MEKEKLQMHLFGDRTTRLYCVLDGASVPDLPQRLYETQPVNHCLFPGELAPDMVHAAPYLVYLASDNPFTDWVLENGFGKHWGIFLHSRHSVLEMRRHFSALVNVYDENARSLIFRFYDPRVLRRFLPTCNGGELKTFFGNVQTFFAEDEESQNLLSFRLENQNLKQTELN